MSREGSNLLVGLDIGSSAVKIAVGAFAERGPDAGLVQILGAASSPTEGMSKGSITSIEDVVSSISACLEETERLVATPLNGVYAGLAGTQIITQNSRGYVVVAKADNEITEQDVERALDSAKSVSTPMNYEILHVSPRAFSVDGQTGIKDPAGMTGVRLEVDAKLILGQAAQIKNLTRAIYRAGLDINGLVLSVLADAELLLTDRQRDLGAILINLGGQTTSLAVYEEGDLLHTAVLPVGSAHITNDLAVGLRSPVDLMEKLKIQYGDCSTDGLARRDEIDLAEFGAAEREVYKLKDVNTIILARVEEIMYLVDKELKKVQRSGLLPAGAVLTGGGAKLPGVVEAAKRHLRLPAAIGYPSGLMSASDKINDPSFHTAIGLVKWGTEAGGANTYRHHGGRGGFMDSLRDVFRFRGGRLKKTISSLIP